MLGIFGMPADVIRFIRLCVVVKWGQKWYEYHGERTQRRYAVRWHRFDLSRNDSLVYMFIVFLPGWWVILLDFISNLIIENYIVIRRLLFYITRLSCDFFNQCCVIITTCRKLCVIITDRIKIWLCHYFFDTVGRSQVCLRLSS